MKTSVDKTELKNLRQQERLGRELLELLPGDPSRLRRAAQGAELQSWTRALRQSFDRPETIKALLLARDLSDPETGHAICETALDAIRSHHASVVSLMAPLLPSEPETALRSELLKEAIKRSCDEHPFFDWLCPGSPNLSLNHALYFVSQNGSRGHSVEWAQRLIQAGADPLFMSSAALGNAIGWEDWNLADFLAPLSDPRRLTQLLKRVPDGKMPGAQSHLEKIELQLSTQSAPARSGPRL